MSDQLPSAVLFACTMNSIRSPMAEAILKHCHPRRIFSDSVGVLTTDINPFAAEVMTEIGLDITRHRAKTFDDLDEGAFDLIVTLSPEAQHRAVELTRISAVEIEYWNVFDPSMVDGTREARVSAFRQVRDDLFARIRQRFPQPGKPL